MSRFFKSAYDSSSTEDEDEDDTEEVSNASEVGVGVSNSHARLDLESLSIQRGGGHRSHRDMLLAALLEERCLREAENENTGRAQYQRLSNRLAALGLVSAGLDHDRHSSLRQTYRDGLNLLSTQDTTTQRASVSRPAQNLLLPGSECTSSVSRAWQLPHLDGPLSLLNPLHQFSLPSSQYVRDFEEIGLLGRGGYGMVFQVKHRLDNLVYAVKKVRIRSSAIARVQSTQNQRELEDMLAELRTLAKLEHPNVVRYYSSWVEWVTPSNSAVPSLDDSMISCSNSYSVHPMCNRIVEPGSLQRVTTAGTDSIAPDDASIVFEESSGLESIVSRSFEDSDTSDRETGYVRTEMMDSIEKPPHHSQTVQTQLPMETVLENSTSSSDLLGSPEPSLALHIQMAMYPMTLADFLWPKRQATECSANVKPLAHCFHLETSIRIMLALLEGVEYIHSRGIVHRDLKPANIFLRLEKNPRSNHGCVDLMLCSACRAVNAANPAIISVCIGDFGLVGRIADQVSLPATTTKSRSLAVGTELYRPPKLPLDVGSEIDIYALGIIAFELLYKFGTQMERRETLQRLRQGQFPPHVPPQAKKIISAMLAERPEEHITISQLRNQLFAMLPA